MSFIQRRLPRVEEILDVLGVSVFVLFSWSLRGFLYNLPSFLHSLSVGAILGILCYMMAFALLESLLLVCCLLLISIVLPGKWYRDGFAYKGFLTILVISITSIQIQSILSADWPSKEILLPKFGIAFLMLVFLIALAHILVPFQKFLLEVTGRLQIFVYLYVPIGLVGLLVGIIRNIA